MASPDGKNDGDEPHDAQNNDSVQPSMTIHPVNYSGMPMHMYPFPPGLVPASQPLRSKRRQVKNACTNCQKACKKCDDARPCLRCVKYGIAEECIDSQRKERKKGIKRGPYKKRDGKGTNIEQMEVPMQQGVPVPNGMPPPGATPSMAPFMGPMGYAPSGFFGQFPPPPGGKPGEAPAFYPPIYIPVPGPPPQHHGQEGDGQPFQPHQYYTTALFAPYPPQYPPYMMHHPRQDGQMTMPSPYYPIYSKPPSAENSGDAGSSGKGGEGHGDGK